MDEKKIEKWECVSKKMTALCKKGFSPRNLKKGAAVVVLVAVAAGAGKVTLKRCVLTVGRRKLLPKWNLPKNWQWSEMNPFFQVTKCSVRLRACSVLMKGALR